MKRDGFLDMEVPVGPVVFAGKLLILVRYMHRFEMAGELAILFERP